jgi:DNA-binding response OmpR family regulator
MARILIIDDEVDLVEACTMALQIAGHAVGAVTDARQALDAARRQHPDLVLLDWVMPGVDGGVVLAQLRADRATARTPVLVISALPDGASRARAAGADGFLAKPFDADELCAKLTSVLRSDAQFQKPMETPKL